MSNNYNMRFYHRTTRKEIDFYNMDGELVTKDQGIISVNNTRGFSLVPPQRVIVFEDLWAKIIVTRLIPDKETGETHIIKKIPRNSLTRKQMMMMKARREMLKLCSYDEPLALGDKVIFNNLTLEVHFVTKITYLCEDRNRLPSWVRNASVGGQYEEMVSVKQGVKGGVTPDMLKTLVGRGQ